MNAMTDLQALAATRSADLRREACLTRLARNARRAGGTTRGGRLRNLALAGQRRLRHVVAASRTAAPVGCCA